MRTLIRLTLAARLLWLAPSDAWGSIAERRAKSEVNITVTQFPDRFDPAAASNYQHFLLLQTVFDNLIRLNESGRITGSLAKRWRVESDGTLYRFELQPDALFHDGTPVSAEDVAYSFARHFWPQSQSAVASHLKSLLVGAADLPQDAIPSGIKVESEKVVSFRLKAPYASFLSVIAMPGFSVLSRKAARQGRMVGSGGMVPRYLPEEKSWRLERNPRYYDAPNETKTFNVRLETDFSRMVRSIAAGESDMALGPPPSEAFSTPLPENVVLVQTKSLVFVHLFLLPRNPQLQDREFRRDLAGLIYTIFKQRRFRVSAQEFAPHFIPLGIMPRSYYKRTVPHILPEDFARKWAGAPGARPLRIMLRETYFTREALKELKDTLTRAGVEVALDPLTPQNFQPTLDSRDYDLVSIPYMSNFSDPDGFMNYLHPGRLFPLDFKPSRDLFDSLRRIPAATHDKERLEQYAKELRAFEDEWYVIPLLNVSMPILCAQGLRLPDTSYRFEAEWRGIYWKLPEEP